MASTVTLLEAVYRRRRDLARDGGPGTRAPAVAPDRGPAAGQGEVGPGVEGEIARGISEISLRIV